MPTPKKEQDVADIRDQMSDCTIAIATDYSGMAVGDMTDLRRALRSEGVNYKVVKNTLAYIAADSLDKPQYREVVSGPTGIAFGKGEVVDPARILADFIRTNRSALKVRGAVMGERVLSPGEVEALGRLPGKDVLVARLMGQLQGPVAGLANVLNGPAAGLARVLQGRIDQVGEAA